MIASIARAIRSQTIAPNGTNDTAMFAAAASVGGDWHVGPGTYYLDDGVVCSRLIHWRLSPAATLVMRSASAGIRAIINFQSGSAGSSFYGGRLVGNRDVLVDDWASTSDFWCGFHILNVDDITWGDVTIEDTLSFGFWVQGARHIARNVRVKNCGKGSQIKQVSDGSFHGLVFDGITNDGLADYQHANEWRDLTNVSFHGVVVKDFAPTIEGLEPKPTAIALETCDRISLNGIHIDGYSGASTTGLAQGMTIDGVTSADISDFTVGGGYTQALYLNSSERVNVSNFDFDGDWTAQDSGIELTNGGLIYGLAGVTAANGRMNGMSRFVNLSNGTVRRFKYGTLVRSGDATFTAVTLDANTEHGAWIRDARVNSLFAADPPQQPRNITFRDCRMRYNGQAGILHAADGVTDLRVESCDVRDNGQDTSAGATLRTGYVHMPTGTSDRARVVNCLLGDTQAFTITDGASYEPGSTDADNRYSVSLTDPQSVSAGQWIKLVNATGSGDITAKVIQVDEDVATVETAAPATFSATGNLTALTGTVTASTVYITGTGTAFDTEIKGFTWMKVGSQYRRIRRVNSATSLVLDSAFTGTISGASAEILVVDVTGIPSQRQGIRLDDSAGARTLLARDNDHDGATVASVSGSNSSAWAPGSVVQYGFVTPVALSTSTNITDVILAPAGWVPVAARASVTTEVAGTSGATMTLEFRDAVGVVASVATFSALTVNGKAKGGASSLGALTSAGSLSVRLAGGADNTPSAGAVRADAVFRIPEMFADLPDV